MSRNLRDSKHHSTVSATVFERVGLRSVELPAVHFTVDVSPQVIRKSDFYIFIRRQAALERTSKHRSGQQVEREK